MKYLFFDTEAASSKDGSKICEFGYVLTNEYFEIISSDHFLINPAIESKEWDWYVVRRILTYKRKEYIDKPIFTYFYNTIRELILSSNYVFGYATKNDVKSINDETRRYQLVFINYDFYDVKEIYDQYDSIKGPGLNQMSNNLQIERDENIHNANADAMNTMLSLKKMVQSLELTMDDLIKLCPKSKDKTFNGEITSSIESLKRKTIKMGSLLEENRLLQDKYGQKQYKKYINKVNATTSVDNDILKQKKVSISFNYEENHVREMLYLIKIIASNGGQYTRKSSESDIFISWIDEENPIDIKRCMRLEYVLSAIDNGKQIEILTFHDFLKLLNITEKCLSKTGLKSWVIS